MRARMAGWGSGLVGVLIFSGSLPATRVAVGAFGPVFLTAGRAVVAAALGGCLLMVFRQGRPGLRDLTSLGIVALGVVLGFPLLTALALRQMTAAHSVVFIGLLPLSTAIFGVARGGERPRPAFWLWSGLGGLLVAGAALTRGGGGSAGGNALMIAAVAVCGLGYAEGAVLTRRLGGWQVISWALILASPVMGALALWSWPEVWSGIGAAAWIGFGYVSVFSMMIGFVFWYRGLALGGIAGVGQAQLLQPFFGLMLAGLVLGEPVPVSMIGVTVLVAGCVAAAKRFA